MFPIRLTFPLDDDRTTVFPITATGTLSHVGAELGAEIAALLDGADGAAEAGEIRDLPRPLRLPRPVVPAGIGAADEAGWRAAGAALSV